MSQKLQNQASGKTLSEQIDELMSLMNQGAVSSVWTRLGAFDPPHNDLKESDHKRLLFLRLACYVYGRGDPQEARKFNASLSGALHAPIRYRLALRLRDFATAARIRRSDGITEAMRYDFRCTMGLHLIWQHRYRWGFPFYRDRHRAINFTRILPDGLVYTVLSDDPLKDPNICVLEQGVGEILLALMHLAAHPKPPETIIALAKFRDMVAHIFPKAKFVDINQIPDALKGASVMCSADLFARAWSQNGRFAPPRPLAQPLRAASSPPLYGICWRGGSGQNRREERHIPLHYFLDLLPDNARYIPLQADITAAENDLLKADRRCQAVTLDVRKNPAEVLSLVQQLAGVISVDSANWHFAGAASVPLFAIMNETAHWFWGPEARAEWTYPSATTVPKAALSSQQLADWITQTTAQYVTRPAPAIRKATNLQDRPLFMAGLPRTGSSMLMECFARHGVWVGETMKGTAANPRGFYENVALKENILKPLLSRLGADPNGVLRLPDQHNLPILPHLRRHILSELARQGYDGAQLWGFKDPKLTLLWPVFARAFPNALWIIPERARDKTIDSLVRAPFMRRHSTDPHYWQMFCARYEERTTRLREQVPNVIELSSDEIVSGNFESLRDAISLLGLTFDQTQIEAAIDQKLFSKKSDK